MSGRVLELNASDERGISVVRDKIKFFAKQAPKASASSSVPPFKIIILDEADSMTHDAQSALRRTMETYSKSTRFCLVCNYVTRIIEPVASRCSKFRFKPLDKSDTKQRLEHIASIENIQFEEGVIDTLINSCDGDLRKAITFLQSAYRLHSTTQTPISNSTLTEIAGTIPQQTIENVFNACSNKKNFKQVQAAIKNIHLEGFASAQVLLQLHDYLLEHSGISDLAKAKCALSIAETDKALTDGADDELQLLNMTLKIQSALNN